MIHFTKIRFKNFLSYGNDFTELILDQNKTTLMIGGNGAGKSTFLDAICFALYGKPYRAINIPQLVNSINKKDMVVEVEFRIGSHEYFVRRGRSPAIFEVFCDNTLLNPDTKKVDYQERFQRTVLKMNFKSFTQIMLMGSASYKAFMVLSALERRNIVEDLLDLQIFTKMNVIHKANVDRNEASERDLNYDSRILENRIELQTKHIESMKADTQATIEDLTAKKAGLDKALVEAVVTIAGYKTEIEQLNTRMAGFQKTIQRKKKFESVMTDIKKSIALADKEIGFYANSDECPTCKQPIGSDFKAHMISHKEQAKAEKQNGISTILSEIEKMRATFDEMSEVMSATKAAEAKMADEIRRARDTQSEIRFIENSVVDLERKAAEQEKMTVVSFHAEMDELATRKEAILREAEILKQASLVLKDTGIKAIIIKQYIPVINQLIAKYLSVMDFFCLFELSETFEETIKSRFRDDFSYASFSEGEKMRINLAVLFTWRAIAKLRNSAATNILIMDEIFDSSLDIAGTEEFMRIISTLTSDTNTFIISHKSEQLYDKFENVLQFEKHHNFSRKIT